MSEYFRSFIKKEHYPVPPNTIRFKTNFQNVVYDTMKKRDWKETDSDLEWDIIWADRDWIHDVMDYIHLAQNQRVNHFRNHYELSRKDFQIKNLKRYKKQLKDAKNEEYEQINFLPQTYNLPSEYTIFKDEFGKFEKNTIWIMKPVGRSQGKGIFLFDKLSQITEWKSNFRYKPENPSAEPYIVQRYVANPLLIGGKKFDLRIYVLCTSFSPLTIYLYRSGFARFTHNRYSNDDISNNYVHQTNASLQKYNNNFNSSIGGKWDQRNQKQYLLSRASEETVNNCFCSIQQTIIHSFKSVQKVIINDKHSFELYGFDFLIDGDLKAWLLEINASPSLSGTNCDDGELKNNLIDDTLTIVDMERVLSGNEVQVGGFDLIYKGGPIIMASNSTLQTLLGCHNNRINQSKQLAKSTSMRLAQNYAEKMQQEGNGQSEKTKYTKNYSSLPTKTGAMYKEAYKEKLRKEKEEKEKEKEVDKEKNHSKPYSRTQTTHVPSTKTATTANTSTTTNTSYNGNNNSKTNEVAKGKSFNNIGSSGISSLKETPKTNKDDIPEAKKKKLNEENKTIGQKTNKYVRKETGSVTVGNGVNSTSNSNKPPLNNNSNPTGNGVNGRIAQPMLKVTKSKTNTINNKVQENGLNTNSVNIQENSTNNQVTNDCENNEDYE